MRKPNLLLSVGKKYSRPHTLRNICMNASGECAKVTRLHNLNSALWKFSSVCKLQRLGVQNFKFVFRFFSLLSSIGSYWKQNPALIIVFQTSTTGVVSSMIILPSWQVYSSESIKLYFCRLNYYFISTGIYLVRLNWGNKSSYKLLLVHLKLSWQSV